MESLLHELKERRIWRTLLAYPAGAFVLLEAADFFVENYGLSPKIITVALIAAIGMLPVALLWNWRHGQAGRQPVQRQEVATHATLIAGTLIAIGWYWSVAAPAERPPDSSAPESRPSIAVLPFATSTVDDDLRFLGDGIAENLVNWLAGLEHLRVISRSSAFAVRELRDPAEIGRRLGVGRALLGRLERRDDRIVIQAELVDTRDGGQLWGDRFARPDDEVLELERAIVSAIVSGLELELSPEDAERVVANRTTSSEAYRSYVQGRHLTHSSASDDIDAGLEMLRESTRLDPQFTLAYAAIAQALTQKAFFATAPTAEVIGEARTAAQSAIALDETLSEAWTALASVRFFFEWDWIGAEDAFERAIALSPGNTTAYYRYADLLGALSRNDEAVAVAAAALELDPLDSNVLHAVGITRAWAGDFAEAAAAFAEWRRLHPGQPWAPIKEGVARASLGECDAGLSLASEAEAETGGWGSAFHQAWLGWIYKLCDQPELFDRAAERVEASIEEGRLGDPIAVVWIRLLQGDVESAIDWLERLVEARSGSAAFLGTFPESDLSLPELTNDPRYRRLLERLNLPQPGN